MNDLRTAAQQALDYWEQVAWGDAVMADKMDALRSALAQQVEPVEPVASKRDTVCALCAREIALEAEAAPFGCVTVRRLSLRHENHADQYQFYPAGQSPYLDNVDECHTVYTAPPQRKPLTDEEIDAVWDQWFGAYGLRGPGGPYTRRGFARAIERAHGITDPQIADRLARHGIPMPGDSK